MKYPTSPQSANKSNIMSQIYDLDIASQFYDLDKKAARAIISAMEDPEDLNALQELDKILEQANNLFFQLKS